MRIGAMTTIAAIASHPLIRTHYIALAEACDAFSTTQVATMGTLGGNIANASPAADTAPGVARLWRAGRHLRAGGRAPSYRSPTSSSVPAAARWSAARSSRPSRCLVLARSRGLVPAVHGRRLPQDGPGRRRHRQGERRDRPDPRRRSHRRRATWPLARLAPPRFGSRQAEALLRGKVFSAELAQLAADVAARRSARSTTFARRHGIAARSSA